MGKDVIIRGETYNGIGKVNLLTENGTANFYDVSGALCTITVEEEDGEESYISDKTAQEVYDALEVGINPVFRFHDLRDNADAYIYASLSKLESTANGEELTLSSFQTDALTAATASDYFELTISPPVEKTVSGSLISITDAIGGPAINVTVAINLAQSGSGTPSPTNVRSISGFSAANIVVSPTTTAGDGTTYTVSFGAAGTVYGGTLDVVNGTLTVTHTLLTIAQSDISGTPTKESRLWRVFLKNRMYNVAYPADALCDKYVCRTSYSNVNNNNNSVATSTADGNQVLLRDDTFTSAADVVAAFPISIYVPLSEAQTYTLTPTEVQMLLGTNNVWSDTNGNVTLTYMAVGA